MPKLIEESLLLLNILGGHPQYLYEFKNKVKLFGMLSAILLAIVMLFVQLFGNWNGILSLGEFADAFTTLYQVEWKLIITIIHRRDLLDSFSMLDNFMVTNLKTNSKLSAIVDDILTKSKKIFNIFRTAVALACVFYSLKPLLNWQKILPAAYTVPCPFVWISCYGFNYAYQVVCATYICLYAIAFDGVFFSLVSYAYIELEAIKYGLKHLNVSEDVEGDDEECLKEFSKLVKHHNHVLAFIKYINKIYNVMFLHQFSSTIMAICCAIFIINLQGFPPTVANMLKFVPFLMAYHSQLFVDCIAGELLMNQAISVGDAAYESKWYVKHQPKLTRGLVLVVQRSTKPEKLKIGSIWDLHMATFTQVVKTSVSVFAFLQTIYEFDVQLN